jgi:hypothetical protein
MLFLLFFLNKYEYDFFFLRKIKKIKREEKKLNIYFERK